MKSAWSDQEAEKFRNDIVQMRAYTSRLLGRETSLVLHGGGNTSVKATVKNIFGENVDVLYVKGSGWDLATIEAAGFAPVRMDVLLKLARLEKLSDTDMVREQKSAMLDPSAPNPSVEAILHAIIPFKFVEHTHADTVVTLTNTPHGDKIVRELYGDRVLYVPYVMPGFILARKIFELTRDVNWEKLDGMILLNHGVFTFDNDAKVAYEKMLQLISQAEDYLDKKNIRNDLAKAQPKSDPLLLAKIRHEVSALHGCPLVASLNSSPEAAGFSNIPNVGDLATRGTLTPDHSIYTKPFPLVLNSSIEDDLSKFTLEYKKYFEKNKAPQHKILDLAPRWAVWPGHGIVSFGSTYKAAKVIGDIVEHTIQAVQWGEKLGGWQPLAEDKLFEVEYWELEQAKLKKKETRPSLQGKIALVTGAASGIGKACVESLVEQGVCVIALDINPEVGNLKTAYGIQCDSTDKVAMQAAVEKAVLRFGGLDIVVSNAGIFPAGKTISELPDEDWDRSLAINLTSHERLIKSCIPYLKIGFDPTIIIIASKNVAAPGPGAAAYSVAKAGLTQLARIAAIELAGEGIRVNILHPDAVFDTGIWTEEVLKNRAKHYGLSVEDYKRKNLLKREVTSRDVANLVCSLAGPVFNKTTGCQISIDGGNDRVI